MSASLRKRPKRALPQSVPERLRGSKIDNKIEYFGAALLLSAVPISDSPKTRPARSGSRALPAASSHSIALLDLYRSVVDRRQHLRRIAGDDDVDHRWAVAFFHSSPQRVGQRFGILNADAAAAHRAGDRGVIHLDQVGRLIAAAHHRVL